MRQTSWRSPHRSLMRNKEVLFFLLDVVKNNKKLLFLYNIEKKTVRHAFFLAILEKMCYDLYITVY